MDRYNEVKSLLKKWEAKFLKEQNRKPSKADVEEASEETRDLYREFRSLKQGRPSTSSVLRGPGVESCPGVESGPEAERGPGVESGPAPERGPGVESGPEAERGPAPEDTDSWGSHLNRGNVTTPMTSAERDSLTASAQYFGMKLKAKLGGAVKERPVSLKKSYLPRTPVSKVEAKKLSLSPNDAAAPAPEVPADNSSGSTDGFQNISLEIQAHRPRASPSPQESPPRKLQQLQAKVGQRLTSLNLDWLERCEQRLGREQCRFIGGWQRNQPHVEPSSPPNPRYGTQEPKAPLSAEPKTTLSSGPKAPLSSETKIPLSSASKVPGSSEPKTAVLSGLKKPVSSQQIPKRSSPGESEKATKEGPNKSVEGAVGLPANTESDQMAVPSEDSWATGTLHKRGHKVEEQVQKVKSRPEPSEPSTEAVCTQQKPMDETDVCGKKARAKGQRRGKRSRDKLTESEEPHTEKSSKRPSKKAKTRPAEDHEPLDPEDQEPSDSKDQTSTFMARNTENLLGELMDEEDTVRKATCNTAKSLRAPQKRTENFVRINLKKKSYVKGFALNGNRLRKQMWKQKWQKKGEQFGGGGRHFNRSEDLCFRCGQPGHWASQCPGRGVTVPPPVDAIAEEEEFILPTLEEVARMTNTQLMPTLDHRSDPEEPMVALDVVKPVYEPSAPPPAMQPLYERAPCGRVCETPPAVYDALRDLGYEKFRPGQEEAVMRILSGLSSLVILSTGMGKSLCYQLPAYMYALRSPCITLVISPLVSLMDDQVSGLPAKLKAVCVHSNMTRTQREAAMDKVKQGKVHVLLLSPEALVGGGQSGSSCLPSADQLPPVAFACIDEVHCVSEWSHNFRPCYLRLCKVLRERLGVRCLLGLTATATLSTAQDVSRHLGVPDDGDCAVRLAAVPPNLHLSVSMDQDREQALVSLLKGERFGGLDSIIIYCTRREETQRLAAMLRTCLQGVTVSKRAEEDEGAALQDRKKLQARKKVRRPLQWMADSYHAGLSSAERRRVQNNFMSGALRMVVATVAFGMGLDKADVRGIIHFNIPKNFESYVQEIGRAGRDGKDAHCHLFLDPEAQDMDELRRHVFADSVDYFTVKKLVQRVFPACRCAELHRKRVTLCRGYDVDDSEMMDFLEENEGGEKKRVERVCHRHERAMPIEETVQALDVREESIETLLCYLELHESRWLELLHPTLSTCRVTCYSGPQQLRGLAHSCPPVAVALARERLSGVDHTHVSSVEFDVVELADSMGWEVVPVKRGLRDLQWKTSATGGFGGTGRSGVLVAFSNLSFHFRCYGDLGDQELEDVCDFLHQKVTSREAAALRQLKACYRVFHSVSYRSCGACAEKVNPERSALLKTLILRYFQGSDPLDETEEEDAADGLRQVKAEDWKVQVCSDVRHFLSIHQDERFTGRAIARIFHGIGSPCYPAQIYGRDRRFWRKYLHLDFNKVMQLCKEEIIGLK